MYYPRRMSYGVLPKLLSSERTIPSSSSDACRFSIACASSLWTCIAPAKEFVSTVRIFSSTL